MDPQRWRLSLLDADFGAHNDQNGRGLCQLGRFGRICIAPAVQSGGQNRARVVERNRHRDLLQLKHPLVAVLLATTQYPMPPPPDKHSSEKGGHNRMLHNIDEVRLPSNRRNGAEIEIGGR